MQPNRKNRLHSEARRSEPDRRAKSAKRPSRPKPPDRSKRSKADREAAGRKRRPKNKTKRMRVWKIAAVFLLVAGVCAGAWLGYQVLNEKDVHEGPYAEMLTKTAHRYSLDPDLVLAVVQQESRFNPKSVSGVGAEGLMQVMPETAIYIADSRGIDHSKIDMFDPEMNADFGCWYLRFLIDHFESIPTAIAAYNAGPTAVTEWLENREYSYDGKHLDVIPYPETSEYVRRVLTYYEQYRNHK